MDTLYFYKNSLRYLRDIWDLGRNDFWSWKELGIKFSLVMLYQDVQIKFVEHYGYFRERMLSQHGAKPIS